MPSINVPLAVLVAQWVALAFLGALTILVYRQLAHLMKLKSDPFGLSHQSGLDVGEMIPELRYESGNAACTASTQGRPEDDRPRARLLAFVDPLCVSCERLLATLESIAATPWGGNVDVLALTTADPRLVTRVAGFAKSEVPIGLVDEETKRHGFRCGVTPFLFAIDAEGRVCGKGAVDKASAVMQVAATLDGAAASTGPIPVQMSGVHTGVTSR